MALLGVGVDIVEAARFKDWPGKPGMIARFFAPEEAAALPLNRPEDYLAARFAAKEAFGKALGTGLAGFSLREVRLERAEGGKPEFRLTGKALEAFERAGGKRIHASLSHDAGVAAAFVVIEGD